jgi:hypothetical protein
MSQITGRGLVSTIKVMSNTRMISQLMGRDSKHNESCENIISKQTRRSLITIKVCKKR